MSMSCLGSGKPNRKKKIKDLQKATDELKKTLENNVKYEKYFLDLAASFDEDARKEDYNSGLLKMRKYCEQEAGNIAANRPFVVNEVALLESLKRKEIEALQDD